MEMYRRSIKHQSPVNWAGRFFVGKIAIYVWVTRVEFASENGLWETCPMRTAARAYEMLHKNSIQQMSRRQRAAAVLWSVIAMICKKGLSVFHLSKLMKHKKWSSLSSTSRDKPPNRSPLIPVRTATCEITMYTPFLLGGICALSPEPLG